MIEKMKSKQLSLFGAGIEKITQEPLYIGKFVLLTIIIYRKKVPAWHEGILFLYKVTSYDIDTKKFELRYQNRMIKEDASETLQFPLNCSYLMGRYVPRPQP